MRTLIIFHVVVSLAIIILGLALPDQFGTFSMIALRVLYLFYYAVMITQASLALARKNRDALLLLIGLLFLVAFGLGDVLIALGLLPPTAPVAHYGMFFHIIIVFIILSRRLVVIYRAEKQYSNELKMMHIEREQMIAELHDGIGGLMTNINLAAEIARVRNTDEMDSQTFSTISTLSKSGLSEIRSFMQALDDDEKSWDSVVADFRLFGVRVLNTQSIGLSFSSDIEKGVPKIGSLTYLNLDRVYREALTNVVKHSEAGSVTISFVVKPVLIILTIADDGKGLKDNRNKGRGMRNMAQRVSSIGGKLTIEQDRGTRLLIEVPQKYP